VLATNYGGGQVVAYQLNRDGSIGRQTVRIQHSGPPVIPNQSGPHPHQIVFSPDNRYVLVPDLGLNSIFTYRLDSRRGTLQQAKPPFVTMPERYGPRHFVFHPNGRFGYLLDELLSAVTVFSYTGASAEIKELQTISTLPDGFAGARSGAEIRVDRAGRYLYASSRSDDTIAVFSIDPQQGTLTMVQRIPTQGKSPRSFALDPTGQYLFVANQRSDEVIVFRIDAANGQLVPTDQRLDVPAPVCFAFVPGESR
jgi:6-phosphogluconolactonase